MRNKTQTRIEELAAERKMGTIDLAVVEDGIEHGRQMMVQMIQSYSADPEAARKPSSDSGAAVETPPSGGNGRTSGPALNEAGLMGGVGSMETKGDD